MNHIAVLQNNLSITYIGEHIYTIRGCRVMLDTDLAQFYGTETRLLKESVKRNKDRFPDDFVFELENNEVEFLRSQSAISKPGLDSERRGGNRYKPFAFTESGIAMLSSVLNSKRAIAVNVQIMRVFVQLRKQLIEKWIKLEQRVDSLTQEVHQLKIARTTGNHAVEAIQERVARHWGLQIEDLTSKARKGSIALARQVAMYIIRQNLFLSLGEIGSHFGRRDHTTVLHALHKVESMLNRNIVFRNTVSSLAI